MHKDPYLFLGFLESLNVQVVKNEELLLLKVRIFGYLSRTVHCEVLLMT